jgi:energy-coupling factor transporter ATP-binding protein EcfA2
MTRNGKFEPSADPFGDGVAVRHRERHRLLGAELAFASDHPDLARLVRAAFAGLSGRRVAGSTPRLRVRLKLTADSQPPWHREPPPMRYFAGEGFVGGAIDASNLALVHPAAGEALVCVSPRLLRDAYYARCELLEFAVYTLATRTLGLAPLHAACVGRGQRGVLIVGSSGAGKSTLALHAAASGLDFLSEDSTLVAPRTLRATGLAAFVHVRDDSLQFVASAALRRQIRQSPVIRRRSGVAKYEVDLRAGAFRLAPAPLSIGALVFLSRRTARPGALLKLVTPGQAIERLTREQLYAARQPTWGALTKNLRGVPAFELRRGRHPDEAVAAIRALLDG